MAKNGSNTWPFYVTGPLLALLTVLALYCFNAPVGLGDALTVASEYCAEAVKSREFAAPPLDWQLGLLLGVFIGALGAAALAGDIRPKLAEDGAAAVPQVVRTALFGLAGGFLVMTGIQLGGDSVLGQFSGSIQLSGAAWIFLIAMAAAAVPVTVLLDRRGGGKAPAKAPAEKKPAAKRAAKGKGK